MYERLELIDISLRFSENERSNTEKEITFSERPSGYPAVEDSLRIVFQLLELRQRVQCLAVCTQWRHTLQMCHECWGSSVTNGLTPYHSWLATTSKLDPFLRIDISYGRPLKVLERINEQWNRPGMDDEKRAVVYLFLLNFATPDELKCHLGRTLRVLSMSGMICIQENLISFKDMNLVPMATLRHILTPTGLVALRERLVSLEELKTTDSQLLQEIIFPMGMCFLREKFLTFQEAAKLPIVWLRRFFTPGVLLAMRENFFTFQEAESLSFFQANEIFSTAGIEAIRGKYLTLSEMKSVAPDLLHELISVGGLQALRSGYFAFEDVKHVKPEWLHLRIIGSSRCADPLPTKIIEHFGAKGKIGGRACRIYSTVFFVSLLPIKSILKLRSTSAD